MSAYIGKDGVWKLMSAECYPISLLPHVSRLYSDYLAMGEQASDAPIRRWYGAEPAGTGWMGREVAIANSAKLADSLTGQAREFGADSPVLENIERLRAGARAVVTGQQVGLLGGPLLTLLKAATAIARAAEATRITGIPHVPIFWLATEDHDLTEVDQVTLPGKRDIETLRLGLQSAETEVGGVELGEGIRTLLESVSEKLQYAPICQLLEKCYTPDETLGGAFARFITAVFAKHGLIVMDAARREFHALGTETLRKAIEHAGDIEAALLTRTMELEAAGYQVQVLVKRGASLLFLIDEETGRRNALRRSGNNWKAGGKSFLTGDLIGILERTPERLSPSALLRPVFQDTILPTAAYVGGPAEVAYFAQSAAVYEIVLGRITPVLPRFSATLIDAAMALAMSRHEVALDDLFTAKTAEALTQRLGARAMPIEGKRRLAAVGNAMDAQLQALTEYMGQMDESLGRSAQVSASKMRYQMNRLRRMAATFEVQKEASLGKHADALMTHLFPDGHPQERILGSIWFLAQHESLIDRLVTEAAEMCIGHAVVRL